MDRSSQDGSTRTRGGSSTKTSRERADIGSDFRVQSRLLVPACVDGRARLRYIARPSPDGPSRTVHTRRPRMEHQRGLAGAPALEDWPRTGFPWRRRLVARAWTSRGYAPRWRVHRRESLAPSKSKSLIQEASATNPAGSTQGSDLRFGHSFGPWCKGSTSGFGPFSPGSNPGGPVPDPCDNSLNRRDAKAPR